MVPTTLAALAELLGMTLQGPDRPFTGLNTLDEATDSEVSFLANPKYASKLTQTKACAVIVQAEHAAEVRGSALISENPYFDFARTASLFVQDNTDFTGQSELATIHPSARISPDCTVYPYVYIGENAVVHSGAVLFPGVFVGKGAVIGADSVLYPHVVVLANVKVGNDCIVHSGAILGTEGFGFARMMGSMQRIPQIGTVEISDRVDIGANTCIDRATLNATSVGKDTKIDNLVQLGHNVTLGEQCLIISQVGIAGSTHVGNRVTIAGQSGLSGHLTVGDDVTIGPQAGITKDIADNVTGSGSPFMESQTYMRHAVLTPKLPEMHKRLKKMEQELKALKQHLGLDEKES